MSTTPGVQQTVDDIDELEGRVYELYEKNSSREFVRHVRFVIAESRDEAEDYIANVDPDYWRSQSIRPVGVNYVFDKYEELHFSFNICKSVLGL